MKIEENRMRRSCPGMSKDQYNVITQSYMTSPTEMTPPIHMSSPPGGHMTSSTLDCSPPQMSLPPQMTLDSSGMVTMPPPPSDVDVYQNTFLPQQQQPPQQLPPPPQQQQQQFVQPVHPQDATLESPTPKVEPCSDSHDMTETPPPCETFPLDDESQRLIEELQTAYNNAFLVKANLQEPNSTVTFINLAESSVRRLVKMVKNIGYFKKLEQKDQIALLKGGVVEILIMRSSKYFDPETKSWRVPVANSNPRMRLGPDMLETHSDESKKLFGQYATFATSLQTLSEGDHCTMLLLIAMSVFSPDRSNLECRDLVGKIQEKYAACLKGYVQQRFGNSRHLFPRLVQKLADIRELNESHGRVLQIVDTKQLDPLLVEIFDLSS